MALRVPAADGCRIYDCRSTWMHLKFPPCDQEGWNLISAVCHEWTPNMKSAVKRIAIDCSRCGNEKMHMVMNGFLCYFAWIDTFVQNRNFEKLKEAWAKEVANQKEKDAQFKSIMEEMELNSKSNIRNDRKRGKYWVQIRYEAKLMKLLFNRKYISGNTPRPYFFIGSRQSDFEAVEKQLQEMKVIWNIYLLKTYNLIKFMVSIIEEDLWEHLWLVPLLALDSQAKLVRCYGDKDAKEWWKANTVDANLKDEQKKHQKLDLLMPTTRDSEKKEDSDSDE